MSYDVEKPDEQWRAELAPAEYAVLRQAGTEPAFTGEYTDTKTEGVYPAAPAVRTCSPPPPSSSRTVAGRPSSTRRTPTRSS